MGLHEVLSSLGLAGILSSEMAPVIAIGVALGAGVLFVCAFVLCMFAFRATHAAQEARKMAEQHFRAAQDLAVEVRHLTAQVEKATARATAAAGQAAPIRIGASETTEEAKIEIVADHAGEAGLEAPPDDHDESHSGHENEKPKPHASAEKPKPHASHEKPKPHNEHAESEQRLEDATRAATVPSALLKKRRRRFF
ncbi:MAG: hypothetical protein GC153_08290 [Alphaproteobacteria bacterium]|nr:hypothetical protein [Alphaproteobacteria bacterium]